MHSSAVRVFELHFHNFFPNFQRTLNIEHEIQNVLDDEYIHTVANTCGH